MSDTLLIEGKKKCTLCHRVLEALEFCKDRKKAGGLSSHCKRCKQNYALGRSAGSSLEEYEDLFRIQGGRCAICGSLSADRLNRRFQVDHNHTTGRVRGLLCIKCNALVGMCQEKPEVLLKTIDYLKIHEGIEWVNYGYHLVLK